MDGFPEIRKGIEHVFWKQMLPSLWHVLSLLFFSSNNASISVSYFPSTKLLDVNLFWSGKRMGFGNTLWKFGLKLEGSYPAIQLLNNANENFQDVLQLPHFEPSTCFMGLVCMRWMTILKDNKHGLDCDV
jgi:hypothetical protein